MNVSVEQMMHGGMAMKKKLDYMNLKQNYMKMIEIREVINGFPTFR